MKLGQEGKIEAQLDDGQELTAEIGLGSGPNQKRPELVLEEGKTHEENGELSCGSEENVETESNPPASPDLARVSTTTKKLGKNDGQQHSRRQKQIEGHEGLSEEEVPCTSCDDLPHAEDEGMTRDNAPKTLTRGGKPEVLAKLGVSSTQPRRSVRLSSRLPQSGIISPIIQGTSTTSISDGDIVNCNERWRNSELAVSPCKLWEISRKAGTICRGDEQEVVKEYICLEERDLEIMKSAEAGKKKGLPC